MENNDQAFIRAIGEGLLKGETAPITIFADWLEETGQLERAEFLRLSLKRLKTNDPREIIKLGARRAILLHNHRSQWLPEDSPGLQGFPPNSVLHPGNINRWPEGFFKHYWVPADQLTDKHGDAFIASIGAAGMFRPVSSLEIEGFISTLAIQELANMLGHCCHIRSILY